MIIKQKLQIIYVLKLVLIQCLYQQTLNVFVSSRPEQSYSLAWKSCDGDPWLCIFINPTVSAAEEIFLIICSHLEGTNMKKKTKSTSEGDANQCSLLSYVVWNQMHALLCVHLMFLSIQNCKWGNINCSCFTLFYERVMPLGQISLFKTCVVDITTLINYLW